MSYTSTGLAGPALDRWREAASGHCYSQGFDSCIDGDADYDPLCATIRAADKEDPVGTQNVFRSMPYCSECHRPWKLLGLAAGGGIILGAVLVLMVR